VSEEFRDAFGDEEVQSTNGDDSHDHPEPELVYSSAVEFFAELLAQSYVREVNEGATFAWCPEWYKHPEALIRVEAIWRAWEHLRLEPPLASAPGG
jgi:homoserine trans-succinylase